MLAGQSLMLQGRLHRYDDFDKVAWLEHCRQLR
jgi:hypothetical protein